MEFVTGEGATKQRFLILHDYGMDGSWWWVRARSAREVLETFAAIEVIETPETIEQAEGWNLEETDVDAQSMPAGLDVLRAQRLAHRHLPGFGALADRTLVYLQRRWDGDDGVEPADYLMEIGSDGRRLRQVELTDNGDAFKSDPDDWPFNPPVVDLFDPELKDLEISREAFEAAWHRARKDDRDL
ncbi:hypothetical protein [Herbidospora yilanensis]|uniref:hypothetical protein n=1 Tax=Herbidospora yilanensis TaxID=354426 RepID=UPI0018DC11B1|nr:hypothetical protein [Herbidospora yilanensis]